MSYRINEMFYSLQGEGARVGEASLFVRFSGCNLQCRKETHGFDCDTEFVSGQWYGDPAKVLAAIVEASNGHGVHWVVFTGGEPLLQLDLELLQKLKLSGIKIAIETNGTQALEEKLPFIDWIVCSPKVAEHAIRLEKAHELRYVRAFGQGIPKPKLRDGVTHRYISPAFDADGLRNKHLRWCVDLCAQYPEWRLSVQQHKLWSIR